MGKNTAEKIVKGDGALPLLISDVFRSRILHGALKPGIRLPAIRKIAADFQVSPVTVLKALDILEQEDLLVRIPVKGVFVSEQLRKAANQQLKACFAFPEKDLTDISDQRENWGLNSEFYRGVLSEAQNLAINLQFTYFQENPTSKLLCQQLDTLKDFDFVIFSGVQLPELQLASAEDRLTFCRNRKLLSSQEIKIDYDREDAMNAVMRYLHRSGCKTAAVLSWSRQPSTRETLFLRRAQKLGVCVPEEGAWHFSRDNPSWIHELHSLLSQRRAEFLFCENSDYMPKLYDIAQSCGLKIGQDILFTSIASGVTFYGLNPPSTYFRIPNYDMGIAVIRLAEEILRRGHRSAKLPLFKVKEVSGDP